MRRYLLDTNQLLRVADRPDLLTAAASAALAQADAILVSVVAAWEIEIKRRLTRADGTLKLEVHGPTVSLVRYTIEKGGVVLPLELDHVTVELDVPCPNRDPFDRVLLQQAQSEGLKLLSSDTVLRDHPLVEFVGSGAPTGPFPRRASDS